MNPQWQEVRVLIWGKTYPELSTKYFETVCTGGTLEDGRFIRLYPIPFRYLSEDRMFKKYQWLRLRIKKSTEDPRPESYKVDHDSFQIESTIPTDNQGWLQRSERIFKNKSFCFDSVEELLSKNKIQKTSLGFVRPKRIDDIIIESRPNSEYDEFLKKMIANKERTKQTAMFDLVTIEEIKSLQYISQRFKISFHCNSQNCNGHNMSILDWEAYELVRKVGLNKANQKLQEILDLSKYDTGFFLGNFRLYPGSFAIGGLWYPKKMKHPTTGRLF